MHMSRRRLPGPLADSVVVVTGASAGIGAATARAAASRGAKVVLVARRTEVLGAVAEEIDDSVPVVADVTNGDGIRAMVDAALAVHGRIDALVNNAGQGLHLPLVDVELDDLRAVFELNVVAPLAAMQAVVPTMRAQSGGAIVNVSSGTSRMVLPGTGAYAATKAALNMLSSVARAELAGDGIAVSTVYPSLTATDFHDNLRAGGLARGSAPIEAHHPDEVAEAICELLESGDAEAVLAHRPAG